MKTALTELIERLEKKIEACNSNNLEREAMGMIEAKAIATELLEKEREQIEEAYEEGLDQLSHRASTSDIFNTPEQYFNETFKQ